MAIELPDDMPEPIKKLIREAEARGAEVHVSQDTVMIADKGEPRDTEAPDPTKAERPAEEDGYCGDPECLGCMLRKLFEPIIKDLESNDDSPIRPDMRYALQAVGRRMDYGEVLQNEDALRKVAQGYFIPWLSLCIENASDETKEALISPLANLLGKATG